MADGGQPGLLRRGLSGAGEDILLDDCSVAPRYRQQLVDELQPILGSRQRAEDPPTSSAGVGDHTTTAHDLRMTASPTFQPAWWLPNPHLQTLWSPFFRRGRP